MFKVFGLTVLLVLVSACVPSVSKNAAKIAYHHEMSNLVSDCFRLGPVKGVVEASWISPEFSEHRKAKLALTQNALDQYGADVDNVVFINTVKVYEGKNTIFAQGAAFKCNG